jgi:DNA-binding LacI/PurR family transcriptional regulator
MKAARSRHGVTLEDVAKEAGVSRATVSRVVNGVRNVDLTIQQTVRRAIDKTGYSPNRAARSLVTRRADRIALVVTGASGNVFTDPFFGRVVSGVVDFLRPRDIHPLLMLVDSHAARSDVIAQLRDGGADGALLVTTDPNDPLPVRLRMSDLPAVGFSQLARPLPYVDVLHEKGGQLAADLLLNRGCRNLAIIAGPHDVVASKERIDGFYRTVGGYVPTVVGDFTMRSGENAMAELLASTPHIDGIFAANDLMARGALQVLLGAGRRVPEDVAIVGFDDSSAALASRPRLTTVRQPIELMGEAMADMLLGRIENPDRQTRTKMFEPLMVHRESA